MAGPTSGSLSSGNAIDSKLGIAGKTILTVNIYRHGVVEVIDILCTDSKHYYIKCQQGQVDLGGTSDWGSGTLIGGR